MVLDLELPDLKPFLIIILVVYQNVSPCTVVMTRLSQLLESCGLQTRSISVSCSFQSVPLLTLRSGIAKNIKSTFIDLTALRSGRIKFSQKGAKYSALIHGKSQRLGAFLLTIML